MKKRSWVWANSLYMGRVVKILINPSKSFGKAHEGLTEYTVDGGAVISIAEEIFLSSRFTEVLYHEFVHVIEHSVPIERLSAAKVEGCTQLALTIGHAFGELLREMKLAPLREVASESSRKS